MKNLIQFLKSKLNIFLKCLKHRCTFKKKIKTNDYWILKNKYTIKILRPTDTP